MPQIYIYFTMNIRLACTRTKKNNLYRSCCKMLLIKKKHKFWGFIILSPTEGQQPIFIAIKFDFQIEFYKKILKKVHCSGLI